LPDYSLSAERWARVQGLFHAALELPAEERDAFLAAACGGDPALQREVELLLRAHEEGGPVATAHPRSPRVLDRLRTALAGRYAVERQLAIGGMALVFLAEDVKHRRKVAIKVLRPDLAVTLGAERFLREIEIAAGLQHPHILPLYDSGSADDLLYYVMPYVEGDTLYDRMVREALPTHQAVQIAVDILSALEYAHRRGVVHRDIKPANILFSASGNHAVVADFGIARAVSAAGQGLTVTGAAMGTPGYMPPEQAAGRETTPRTDIYAVGIVLYECLTGRRWPAPTDLEELDWGGIPSDLCQSLKRALAWSPEDRWSDATAFRDSLMGKPPQPAAWRRNVAAIAGPILLLVFVVVAGLMLRGDGGTPTAAGTSTRIAVLPFTVRGTDEFAYLGEGMVDLLSTKLDGAGNWRSVDPRAVLSMVAREGGILDPERARPIASGFGAGLYVLGNIVEVGGRLRLDASLYEAGQRSEAIAHASAEGGAEEVLELVDDMAAQLFAAQSATGGARLTQIAVVTTSSLPALKSYLNGVRDLRAARFPEAAAAFQDAVAADSTFALAWYQLSVAADWLIRADLARHAAEQAVRFGERLSERDRRLMEALYAARIGDAEQAERLYRSIVGTYPEDFEAWSQLGETLFHFGPRLGKSLGESREVWERVRRLDPDQSAALVHLARVDVAAGNVAGLDSMAQKVIELVPEGDRTLEMQALMAFTRDDPVERARVRGLLNGATDEVLSEIMWSVGSFLGDLDAAIEIARIVVGRSGAVEMQSYGHGVLAHLFVAQGRWRRGMAELDALAAIDPASAIEYGALLSVIPLRPAEPRVLEGYRGRLQRLAAQAVPRSATPAVWFSVHDGLHPHLKAYLLALVNAVLGDELLAESRSSELRALPAPPGSGSLVPDMLNAIAATVDRRAGRREAAIQHADDFQLKIWHQSATGSPFLSQSYERYLRAVLLEEAGRFDEALRWFGSFQHTNVYDLIYLAPSHIRRGEIAERMGDVEAARHHYQRAIELWGDADPELQVVVEDARERMASLGVSHP
jgi:serine/threonine-protein kinase